MLPGAYIFSSLKKKYHPTKAKPMPTQPNLSESIAEDTKIIIPPIIHGPRTLLSNIFFQPFLSIFIGGVLLPGAPNPVT